MIIGRDMDSLASLCSSCLCSGLHPSAQPLNVVFSLGVGPMAWFISTELSTVDIRDKIQSLSISCQYVTCFISSLVFLPLYQVSGPWSFLLFICPLSFCAIYLFVYLPETKNRQIGDVVDELQRRSLLGKTPPNEN